MTQHAAPAAVKEAKSTSNGEAKAEKAKPEKVVNAKLEEKRSAYHSKLEEFKAKKQELIDARTAFRAEAKADRESRKRTPAPSSN